MNKPILPFLFLALSLAIGARIFGQSFEGSVSGGQSRISHGDLGSGYSLDSGFRLTFRMMLNTREHLGYEFGYGYNRTYLVVGGDATQEMEAHQGFGDVVLYALPPRAGSVHSSREV